MPDSQNLVEKRLRYIERQRQLRADRVNVVFEGKSPVGSGPTNRHGMPKLPVGRAVWKPAPDFQTSAAAWLAAGAAHHTVMTTAVGVDVFRDFADMARVELLVIDEDTTVRGFEHEVRWNQAYYRLAQGL